MLAYVVVVSRTGTIVDPAILQRITIANHPDLAFAPDEFRHWAHPGGAIHFAGWQAFTEFHTVKSHWHVDESGLTAFSGNLWPLDGGWDWEGESWAAQLAAVLRDHPAEELHENMFGIFTAVHIPIDGRGHIVTDLLSSGVVFTATLGDAMIFSSNAALCAAAITPFPRRPERDIAGTCWLTFRADPPTLDTGFAGVRLLPFNALVTLDPVNGARVDLRKREVWESDDLAALPCTIDALGAHLEHDLRQTIRTIASLPAPKRLVRLSGGRDSRSIAALIVLEGLQDRFQFQSSGLPATLDVVTAEGVAEQLGLQWEFDDRSRPDYLNVERAVRIHAFQTSGTQTAWDHKGTIHASPTAKLSGSYSEPIRLGPGSLATISAATDAEAIATLAEIKQFDQLRFLLPEARAHYVQKYEEWFKELLDRGVEVQRVGSLFVTVAQLRRMYGMGDNASSETLLFPLYTPTGYRTQQHLPAESRHTERFLFDIIRRCSEPLAMTPLAGSTWAPDTYTHLPNAAAYAAIPQARHAAQRPVHWRVARLSEDSSFFREILLDASNPMYELVAFDRVRRLFEGDRLHNAGTLREMYGLLAIAVWLGGHELPWRINRAGIESVAFDTRESSKSVQTPSPPIVLRSAAAVPEIVGAGTAFLDSTSRLKSEQPNRTIVLAAKSFPRTSETFVVDQFLHLLARGWDVWVQPLGSYRGNLGAYPEIESEPLLSSRILAGRDLARAIRDLRPALVHFQFGDLALGRLGQCEAQDVRSVVSFRGYDICYEGLDRPNFYQEVWNSATAIHTVSSDLMDKVLNRGCPPAHMRAVIHGSVDPEFFDPGDRRHCDAAGTRDRPLKVISVGRLVWKKRHETSLRVVRELLDRGVNCKFTLIGEGRLREEVVFEAHDLGIADNVAFIGAADRHQIRAELRTADVFLLSSISEGFSIAALEAQSMGVPVVCTDAEGLSENVESEVTGIVCSRRDHVALSDAVERLALDPLLRQRMGMAGRARVCQRFTPDREIDGLEKLYLQVLELLDRQ